MTAQTNAVNDHQVSIAQYDLSVAALSDYLSTHRNHLYLLLIGFHRNLILGSNFKF
jgi:hypothetical protein